MTSAKELIAEASAYTRVLHLLGHSIKIIGDIPTRPNQFIEMELDGKYFKFKLWNYPSFLKSIVQRDINELNDKAWRLEELDK